MALRCEPFDICDHCSGQMFPGLVVTCFFVSLPWTHTSCWRIFVQQRESCDINLRFRQWLVAVHAPINHRWSPLRVHQDLLLFDSGHHYISGVSENRPSEHWVSSLQQHGSDTCSLSWYFRHFVELQELVLDLELLLSRKLSLKLGLEVASRLYTAVDNGFHSCNIFSLLYGHRNTLSLFCMPTSFDSNLFTWLSDGGIVSRLSVSAINRSTSPTSPPLAPLLPGLKAVPMNIPGKAVVPNRCTRLWS